MTVEVTVDPGGSAEDRAAATRARARATTPLQEGGVALRPATEADAGPLVAWHRDPDVLRFWDGETFTHEQMSERLARADVDAYIVETGGRPIGYVQSWFAEDETGIDMFLVPAARGRGLGPAAAQILVRHLLAAGRQRITVDPYLWNTHAVAAWRRAGFRPVAERPADDEHSAAWLLMELDSTMLPQAPRGG